MTKIVLYFSYTGNTRIIAEKVAKEAHADLEEIKAVIPYTADYQVLVNDTEDNRKTKLTPPIQPLQHNLKNYDEIILGSPLWWYTIVPPIRTFLKETDLTGKKVVPFVTNAGWPGTALKEASTGIEKAGGTVVHPLAIRFSEDYHEHRMLTTEEEFEAWIKELD